MTGRRAGRATAWLWTLLLLVGLPAGLAWFVGWPLPRRWPSRGEWDRWLQDPLTGRTLRDLFAVAVWLLWAVLGYAVLADLAARVRRGAGRLRRLRLPPLPTALRAAANGLLGAAVVGTGTATVAVVATAHPPAPAAPPGPGHLEGPNAPPPQAPAPTAAGDDQPTEQTGAIGLPNGGWVSRQTAAAVAASGAMVWRQRRRHYQPRPLTGVARDDPDLAPLPPTVAAVIQQVQPPPDQPPTPAPIHGQPPEAASGGGVAVVGERVGEALPLSALPAGGVGLVGPAAQDAARGVLIAALLAGQGAARPRVVTTQADLTAMLDTPEIPNGMPGLAVASTVEEAVAAAEDVALARANPVTGHGDPPDTSPVVLLVAAPTDPPMARRLLVLLQLAGDKAVSGVLLGPWRPETTWHVQPGGTFDTTATSPVRLSVLPASATRDLLAVYREAHTPPHTHTGPGQPESTVDNHPAARVPPQPRRHSDPPEQAAVPQRSARVQLVVLGPPAVYRPGHSDPVRWPRTAALPVLVYLALHPAGATSTELAVALWPQLHPNTTTNRVYNIISTVRSTLDDPVGGPTLLRDGDRYRLNPGRVEVDLWRLHDAIRTATTSIDPAARVTSLREVVNACTGELAGGWPWPWLDPHREAIRRQVLDAHATLAAAPATAARPRHVAVAAEPDKEPPALR